MITNVDSSILYFCTDCPTVSYRTVSPFDLKKNEKLVLKCENNTCSCDIVTITYTNTKYKISVFCPICADEHIFYISPKTLWKKDFFILKCPESGFGVVFIGKDIKRLTDEYNSQNELIAGIVADNDADYDTLEILFEIIEKINAFSQDDSIRCKCNSRDIAININPDSVSLVCKSCNSSMTFPANEHFLKMLCRMNGITLK